MAIRGKNSGLQWLHPSGWLAAAMLVLLPLGAAAQEPVVGLAAPLTGFAASLGERMKVGALAASPDEAPLLIVDTACTAEGGERAAIAFVEKRVPAVTGFLCTEALEAALPVLTKANIAVFTTGVRTDSLTGKRDKTGHLLWRIAPRASHEAEAAAALLLPRWRTALFAIIDDGTIYGRELAEQFRLAAEDQGLKPVYSDTFRPQLANQTALAARLRKAGATHVFVGGDRADIAVIARDAAALDYPLEIAGGEALLSADGDVPLATGVLAVVPQDPTLPADALARLEALGIVAEGPVAPSWLAVRLVREALKDGVPANADGWRARLDGKSFKLDGVTVGFDGKGDLAQNPYRLMRWTGSTFEDAN